MSFHYVLPSNTCPELYPSNSASKYSTAIGDRISLTGHWEVALTGVTCSNCINTFHNDVLTIEEKEITKDIKLKPEIFRNEEKAINYVNQCVANPNVHFSVSNKNYVTLNIKSKDVTVKFSDTLRDIFAFTKNTYSGIGHFMAEDEFSLTRCIDFLYIYSNISEYVRVGNIKTPLLGIVTLNAGRECNKLSEHLFNNPTYISLIQNEISEINIEIYDGAGELIPFAEEAITVTRLHFRRII